MKVIPLNCNHCGAPIEAPPKARFITCTFCDARLQIHHSGSSYSTEVLDEIRETTHRIARDIEELKSSTAIDRLDKQWERERKNYLVTGKHGTAHMPSKSQAVVGGVVVTIFGLFWTAMAFSIVGAGIGRVFGLANLFPLFGLLFVGLGIFNALRVAKKADEYERDHDRYVRQRHELLNRESE